MTKTRQAQRNPYRDEYVHEESTTERVSELAIVFFNR